MFRAAAFSFGFAAALTISGCAHAELRAQTQTDCNEQGYSEQIVEPAVIEYGELQRDVIKTARSHSEHVQPIVTKVMSQAEYLNLPKMISVRRAKIIPAVFEQVPFNISIGEIAEYDILTYPNGSESHRILGTSIPKFDKARTKPVLVSQPRVKWVDDMVPRPEPVRLPNGELQVVITPYSHTYIPIPLVFEDVRDRYVKSRTPAIIALTRCTQEK